MTNPNNAVGTNGAFGGRTSVNAFNDVMGAMSRGILSGWACVPNSGLTVSLGGNGTVRDCAVAVDNVGNKTSINNISNSPINVTLGAAPGTNARIDAIVAYVDNPPTVSVTATDNPGACGLIVVEGNVSASPSAPGNSKIRTAITADGASGTTAYYVVLATVRMASGTTDITSSEITAGTVSKISSGMVNGASIVDSSVTASKLDFTTLKFGSYSLAEQITGFKWIDNKDIYKKTVYLSQFPNNGTSNYLHTITNLSMVINVEAIAANNTTTFFPIPFTSRSAISDQLELQITQTDVVLSTSTDFWYNNNFFGYVTIYYTKSS